jgi:SAM-dependent methyltransferase
VLEYRSEVYPRYASVIKRYSPSFDTRAAEAWAAAFQRYLRGWLPDDRRARIIDLGCGSGRMLYLLRQLGYENLQGIDISAEQVQLARQVVDDVIEGDVLKYLRESTESCDLIVALDLIEHLTKDEATDFLQAIEQRLKPGGRLILNTPNAVSPFAGSRRYGDFTHEIGFAPSCLAQVLELFGLTEAEPRELGPYPHGLFSTFRTVLWQAIRGCLSLYNYVEVGHHGGGVFTRDFLISAVKPTSAQAARRSRAA